MHREKAATTDFWNAANGSVSWAVYWSSRALTADELIISLILTHLQLKLNHWQEKWRIRGVGKSSCEFTYCFSVYKFSKMRVQFAVVFCLALGDRADRMGRLAPDRRPGICTAPGEF